MTNRDKINKMTNEELAKYLFNQDKIYCCNREECDTEMCAKKLAVWLSYEKEETDKQKLASGYEKSEIIQLTKKAYNDILERLNKLEKCNRIAEVKEHIEERLEEEIKNNMQNAIPATQEDEEEFINKIGQCAKEVKRMNKTADEMFEELGYKKSDDIGGYLYENENEERIAISKSGQYLKSLKRNFEGAELHFISEQEDKAIHKKIEEVTNRCLDL